jgi:iron(III) transport system substrate-binding protein
MLKTTRTWLRGAAAALALAAAPAMAVADTLPERFADLYEAARKDGQVVFYTSYRQETSTALLEYWSKNFPGVKLNIVQKQTLDLIPTIEAEKAAGRTNPDLVFINQRFILEDWIGRGYIEPYKVRDFDQIPDRFKEKDGNYYVVSAFILSAAYNPKVFPDPSVLPKKISDFLDPKWKGRLVFSDPKSASSQLTWFQALLSKGVIDWDTIADLAKQDLLLTRGNAESVRLLVAGERDLSPLISSQNVLSARERGQNIDLYVLDEGAVVQETFIATFKGGPNPSAAKLLTAVLNSPEGQELTASSGAYWPTHPDASPPKGLPKLQDIKTIWHDEPVGGEESVKFLERFDEVFDRE